MARKNLLGSLMGTPEAKPVSPAKARPAPTKPIGSAGQTGAIGAVSQTIADLKARAVAELDPHLIDAGGLADRLEHDATGHAQLMASIEEYGQQVPVLVRPHPETQGRYQIVYGRRRVLALRDLGQPVKAMIRDLDDAALIMAQGQENNTRRDLSFIEKANFARQMREAGYKRKVICDALSIDKTEISRMLSVVDRIPLAVIEAIGSAPSVGRARWQTLADVMETKETPEAAALALIMGETSDARFDALMKAVTLRERRTREAARTVTEDMALKGSNGRPIGRLQAGQGGTALRFPPGDEGFARWLADNMDRLHAEWSAREKR